MREHAKIDRNEELLLQRARKAQEGIRRRNRVTCTQQAEPHSTSVVPMLNAADLMRVLRPGQCADARQDPLSPSRASLSCPISLCCPSPSTAPLRAQSRAEQSRAEQSRARQCATTTSEGHRHVQRRTQCLYPEHARKKHTHAPPPLLPLPLCRPAPAFKPQTRHEESAQSHRHGGRSAEGARCILAVARPLRPSDQRCLCRPARSRSGPAGLPCDSVANRLRTATGGKRAGIVQH
jgi:hypothetical protein